MVKQICRKNDVKNIAWSPDETKLAYELAETDGDRKVLVVDSGDCNGEPFNVYDGQQPAWKNAEELAMRVPETDSFGSPGLRLVNINTNNKTQLTVDKSDSFPAWSQDGQRLVFTSERQPGNPDIYLLEWDGPKWVKRQLIGRPAKDTTPVFGPDAQEVYFLSDFAGKWQIRAISLDGKLERVVVDNVENFGSFSDWGLARPAVLRVNP